MQYQTIRAYAPASIGNVSLGFDLLGAALKPIDGSLLGDEVEIREATAFSLSIQGAFAHKLPASADDNIISHCYRFFSEQLQQRREQVVPVAMVLYKNLPIGSGLGSSASSIVAALHGLNAFYGEPFTRAELLQMMGELEGQISGSVHYDNVAPSYLGGLVLMAQAGDKVALSLPVFDDWYWVVCYSGIKVSTAEARRILPSTIPLADTLTFGRQLGVFVHALHTGDRALAGAMMQDVIAEPHRKALLPGFEQARDFCQQTGAIAFGISGSGPTVFAVTDDMHKATAIQSWLGQHYIQNSEGFSRICRLDLGGSQALKV